MSAELAGKAFVEMSLKGREEFAKGFTEMQAAVQRMSSTLQNVKSPDIGSRLQAGLKGALKSFKDLTAAALRYGSIAGAALGGAALVGFTDAIHKASDLQETLNKFRVVFGSNAAEMEKWGIEFAKQMGRSKKEVLEFMANTQGLVVPMGVDQGDAQQMSQTLTRLAFDMASFHNTTDLEAWEALRSAITGESEPMKRFGVIVNETATKAELLKKGLDPDSATEAQKAMARYNIILQGTAAAQGDVERSGDSFANRLKALQASWSDFSAELGTVFLPIAEAVLGWLRELVMGLGGADDAMLNTTGALGSLGGASKATADSASFIVKAWATVDFAFNTLMGSMRELMILMVQLSRLVVNNPLTRGAFGEEAIKNLDTILEAVQKSTEELAGQNADRGRAAWETMLDPQAGQNALDEIDNFTKQAKEKYKAQAEALKKAREESGEDPFKQFSNLGPQEDNAAATKKKEALELKKRKRELQIEMDNLRERTDQPARLENLDRNSTEAYKRFQENQYNEQREIAKKQLKELEKVRKSLEDDKLGIVEIE